MDLLAARLTLTTKSFPLAQAQGFRCKFAHAKAVADADSHIRRILIAA
jgi:hypothetical protein